MKNSNPCHSFTRLFQAHANWAKVLCRASVVIALALVLPNQARALDNVLINGGFTTGDYTGWTTYAAETWAYTIATDGGCCYGQANVNNGVSYPPGSPYSFYTIGDYQGTDQFVGMYQDYTSVTAGDVFTADGWGYSYANDWFGGLPNGSGNPPGQAWIEVSFRDSTKNNVLALYRSVLTWPAGGWVDLSVTNQYDLNTYAITNTVTTLVAPPGTADVRYQVVFNQLQYSGGSVQWDDFNLNFISGPVPPTMSSIGLNNLTLCTNTYAPVTATAAAGKTISSFQVIATTSSLSSIITTTVTNTYSTNSSFVSGIGTGTATIKVPLTTNLNYVLSVSATDNTGTSASTGATFDTIAPALVIEATDFNFSGGGFIDTPQNGGVYLYAGALGTEGVDEHKNCSNPSGVVAYRSASDEVVIQDAGSVTFNEQKFIVANQPELVIDYTCSDDWFDYTRTYGPGGSAPAGTYNVWLCMGTSGSGPQATLSRIAGDPTSSSQSPTVIGNFGTASFAENSWAGYEYVPLTDQYGNLASTTIPAGQQTLRLTQIANPNLAYIILMPVAPKLTPSLAFVYPDGAHPFESTNHITFTVGPANGSNIASSGIHLVLNGADVTGTPGYSATQSGSSWTVSYPIVSNAIYTASLDVTNSAGLYSIFPVSFDTFDINNYQWEAVDYDFSTNNGSAWISALFIDNPVPSCEAGGTPQEGELAANSYFAFPTGFSPGVDPQGIGAIAQQGIDMNFPNDGQSLTSEYYRADGVGSQPASDYVRPKFLAAQAEFSDSLIGPINIGYYASGYWLNYTRHYPTNNYYVWGRLASGGAYSGTSLGLITGGVGTVNQTNVVLGTFSDPHASGYQAWHWIPLLDGNGNKVVVSLGGQATLRVTSSGLNTEFFMLVVAPPMFSITPSVVSGQLNLSIPTVTGHTYTLLYKSTLTAPSWTTVGTFAGNGSPHVFIESLSGTQGYYEVSVQ